MPGSSAPSVTSDSSSISERPNSTFDAISLISGERGRDLVVREDVVRLRRGRGLFVSGKGGGALRGETSVKSTILLVGDDAGGAVVDRVRVTGMVVIFGDRECGRVEHSRRFLGSSKRAVVCFSDFIQVLSLPCIQVNDSNMIFGNA